MWIIIFVMLIMITSKHKPASPVTAKISRLFTDFFESEKAGGLVLIICTFISLAFANSSWADAYHHLWSYPVANHPLEHWINDGLMAIFFLLIGLELEREVYAGELSSLKNAMLPVSGAIGGMLLPAGIYLLMNRGLPTASGAGIPMATDIAFALGILSLLGKRVPASLKIFLTALAVIDDLGAILVIAFFYSKGISFFHLGIAMGLFALLLLFNRMKIEALWVYLLTGVVMWYFMLHSGIHATITGVLVAFAIPFGNGGKKSVSYQLQHFLHKPVAFLILPLFAMANTAIPVSGNWLQDVCSPHGSGIIAGLVFGKPLGIFLAAFLLVKTGRGQLPGELSWKHTLGAGCLGGIGFTMSIFITLLAFEDSQVIQSAKIMILLASLVAAFIGFICLHITLKEPHHTEIIEEADQ